MKNNEEITILKLAELQQARMDYLEEVSRDVNRSYVWNSELSLVELENLDCDTEVFFRYI